MKKIVAIMYDFDKTLCDRDMQEYGFIPAVSMSVKDFWDQTTNLSISNNMDKILAYMYMMMTSAKKANISLTKDFLQDAGKKILLFDGVEKWFRLVKAYGKGLGLEVEHYIISSGLKEIIEGTSIAKEFKEIYACEFHYNNDGIADWPKMNVNYTTKTQFLFRISKGILDSNDDYSLNSLIADDKRRVPYQNMIYLGDGITDVPCMKLVKTNGGSSIAVYQKGYEKTVKKLLSEDRVNFAFEGNYSQDGQLFKTIKLVLEEIALKNALDEAHEENKFNLDI